MTYQDVLDALDSILEKLRGNNSELCEKLGIEIDDPYINGEDDDSEEVDSEEIVSDEGDLEDVNAEIDNADDEQLADDEDETSVNEAEAKKDAPKPSMIKKAADKVSGAWDKTTKWAKDNPGKAVAAAAGTGLATALIGDMVFGDDDEEEDESTQQSFNESNDDSFTDHLGVTKDKVVNAASSVGKTATKPVNLVADGVDYAARMVGRGIDSLGSRIPTGSVKAEKPKVNVGQPEVKVEKPKDGDKKPESEEIVIDDLGDEESKKEKPKDGDKKPESEEIVIDDLGDEESKKEKPKDGVIDDKKGETDGSQSNNDAFGIQKAADTVKSGAITGGALIGGGIGAGLLGSALLNRRRRRRRRS